MGQEMPGKGGGLLFHYIVKWYRDTDGFQWW